MVTLAYRRKGTPIPMVEIQGLSDALASTGGVGNSNLPFYLSYGTQSNIPCVGATLIFYLSNGTQSNIVMV